MDLTGQLPNRSLQTAPRRRLPRDCMPRPSSVGLEEGDHREHAPMVVVGLGEVCLAMMLLTCFSTVPSVTPGRRAMPIFDRPSAINEVDRGGHFAAWEQLQLFASEV